MPSTYSPNLRIELIANGEQSGTWGTTTNTNLGTLIEDAISGYVSVSVIAANQALTALNGAADQSRNMVINLTTTTGANFNVYIPPADKFYVIRNASAYDATIYCSTVIGNTTAAGTGVTIPAGRETLIFADGANVSIAIDYAPAMTLGTALAVTSGGTGSTTASGARTNLGLGTIATQNANAVAITGGSITGITDLAIADGGTGASDAATARSNLSVPSTTGSGASGTWSINISGNATTATSATTASALTASTWQRITGNAIDYGSYGSIGVSGTTGGYAGISFSGVSGALMMSASSSGFYFNNSTWRVYWDGSGNQLTTGDVTAYSSDERLKKNIQPINNPLEILAEIDGVYFDWDIAECNKWHFYPPQHDAGLLAQRVQKVYPYAVRPAPFDQDPMAPGGSKSGQDYLTVQYEKLVPVLVQATKQLTQEVEKLRAEVEALKKGS